MKKIIKIIMLIIPIIFLNSVNAEDEYKNQFISFMITNEGIKKGHIKIKQRDDSKSPFLIIGCNQKNEDFEVLIGNLNNKEFSLPKYNVISSFKDRTYKEIFVPVYKDGQFFLMKKTNQLKNNQLFVYQYLKTNQVILEFPQSKVFYFNAKARNSFTEYMNIVVTHCEMKI